jgi:hypothetical protein
MKKGIILLVFLLLGIIFTSGCINPQVSAPVSPETAPPTSTPIAVPQTSSPPGVSLPSVTLKSDDFSQNTGTVTEPTTRIQVDNPYLEYLQVRKKTFDYSIPNCPMKSAFPAIVNDPDYGIQHQTPKLTALTEDQYEVFLRKYTEGKAENTQIKDIQGCQGAEGKPEWNFVEIRVILDPTNIRPTNYTISQNVRSNGKIIAQFTTIRTLVINEKITLTSYVPLKSDELDLFDTVSVTYTRQ